MRRITLQLSDNPPGADPEVGLYKAINAAYPALGLTQANSTVMVVQPAQKSREQDLTRVQIQKNVSPLELHSFLYNRFDILTFIKLPYFSAAEITQITALKSSADLLAFIAKKSGKNLRNDDFWVNTANKDLSGGSTPPNWRMKANDQSIYWKGEIVLPLHA